MSIPSANEIPLDYKVNDTRADSNLVPILPTSVKEASVRASSTIISLGTHFGSAPSYHHNGWTVSVHPEGKRYAHIRTAEGISVVTEAPVTDSGVADQIDSNIAIVRDLAAKKNIHIPETSDLFLEIDQDSGSCNYWFADHANRTVFWLHPVDTIIVGLPNSCSQSHLKYSLEENYWSHVEMFPATASQYSLTALEELQIILLNARADALTSDVPTFPYTAEECERFLDLLRSGKEYASNPYITTLVARLWVTVANHRFFTHFGEDHCRLSSTRAGRRSTMTTAARARVRVHPTYSSWRRNINTLSTLINRLCELADTAPQDIQPQLHRQVTVLRADLKKQQERCSAFLRLTKEYADRFLSDISEEIQQQSSFLEAMERRLDMAKSLRKHTVDLRKSYEVRTLNSIKEVRHTVLSQPLPQETDLFSEMDIILREIRRCYIEMDKFWVEEVRRVTKALKDRRVDPKDIGRWKNIKESLTQTIAGLEKISTDDNVTPRPNIPPSVHDLGSMASSLSGVAKAAYRALKTARLGPSAEVFLKPVHYSVMLRAECNLLENRGSFVDFLRECVRYGKTVVMTCVAFVPYSPFSRSRASQDLVDDAARLKTERTEIISSETTVLSRDMRKFNSIYKKSLSSLHKMDRQLETLFSCIDVWVTKLDGYSTFPAFDIKHLQSQSRVWVKKRDAVRNILAAL